MSSAECHVVVRRVTQEDHLDACEEAAELLGAGELVVMPTDTVYGVAGSPMIKSSLDRLAVLKGRDADKPIALLASGVDAIVHHGGVFCEEERRLAKRYWPGPLTLILRNGSGAEGYRVPDSVIARALLEKAGGVLWVTSANVSGACPATNAEEALECLGNGVAMVLDGGVARGEPSTVVRVMNGVIEILREGVISSLDIEKVANDE